MPAPTAASLPTLLHPKQGENLCCTPFLRCCAINVPLYGYSTEGGAGPSGAITVVVWARAAARPGSGGGWGGPGSQGRQSEHVVWEQGEGTCGVKTEDRGALEANEMHLRGPGG